MDAQPSHPHLTELRGIAEKQGGLCLATEYKGGESKLAFRCRDGHEWFARPSNVRRNGSWCPVCARKKIANSQRGTLEEYQALALARGGLCLSPVYIDSTTPLQFSCAQGHVFDMSPSVAKNQKSWCPFCAKVRIEDPIGELKTIAMARGGECLADAYINSKTKVKFRCADGHVWLAKPNSIKNGTWCPTCINKTEGLVRLFLECVLGAPFPSAAPAWLQEPGKRRRILDGYCPSLSMAFEYHGEQHFRHVAHFHERPGEKTYEEQVCRDNIVRQLCQQHGVALIEVPTLPDGYSQDEFIQHAANTLSATLPHLNVSEAAIANFRAKPFGVSKLELIKAVAKKRGGDCISKKFISVASPLEFVCADGHTWHASAKDIQGKGSWCPTCSGRRQPNILQKLAAIAVANEGQLLSTEYLGTAQKLEFKCKAGHLFESRPSDIKRGVWCPYCAKCAIYKPIDTLTQYALSKGGELLSVEYQNDRTPMKFRCQKGHTWETTAHSIRNGHWCPYCSGTRLVDPYGDICAYAEARGGLCLSDKYLGSGVKHWFRCAAGHEWASVPASMKHQASWCAICARRKRAVAQRGR